MTKPRTALLLSTAIVSVSLSSIPLSAQTATGAQTRATYTLVPETAPATSPVNAAPVVGLGLLLLAAGAGMAAGGGGDDGTTGPQPNPQPDPTPEPEEDTDPFETTEYFRNWGLDHINAQLRYRDGGTGQSSLAGVFDSGVDLDHPDMVGKIEYAYDYFTRSANVDDINGHGTHVATTIAGLKNGIGTHGVAYDGKLAIFRAFDGPDSAPFDFIDAWADATTISADLGANAMNNSWNFVNADQSTLTIDQFSGRADIQNAFGQGIFDALDHAVLNDMVMVYAAGNAGKAEAGVNAALPVYFPEYEDHTLVAIAIDMNDQIPVWSNRCGLAAEFCLAAPGVNILAGIPGGGFDRLSGTSMAAPHITGAVMVLASNFPELTGAEISRILRDTARDLGAPGVDAVYGNGALDLANAVAPQGRMTFQTSEILGARSFDIERSHFVASGGMARALEASLGNHSVMVTDRYNRGYQADMSLFLGSGVDAIRAQDRLASFTSGQDRALRASEGGSTLAYARNGLADLQGYDMVDAAVFAPYASALSDTGGMAFSTDLGGAVISLTTSLAGEDHSYAMADVSFEAGFGTLSLGMGQLDERGGFLGSRVSGAFGTEVQSETRFAAISATLAAGPQQDILFGASTGQTDFGGDGMIRSGTGIQTSSYGIGFATRDAFAGGDRFSISASQSLNVQGGSMQLALPAGLGAAEGGVRSSAVSISNVDLDLARGAAPIELRIGYEMALGEGRLAAGLVAREGDAEFAAASIGYSIRF